MGKIKRLIRRVFFGKKRTTKYQPKSYDSFRINDLERDNRRLNSVITQLMAHLKYTEFGNVIMTEREAKRYKDKGVYPPYTHGL